MDLVVFAAVLLAAAFHAGWNTVVKVGLDQFLSVTLIFLSAGAISLCAVPFVGVPAIEAWPWLLASTVIHTGYKLFLVRAYSAGDMGQVYPIARGTAPLLVSVVMAFSFGEVLAPVAMFGITLLTVGICLMSIRGGRSANRMEWKALAYALGTSLFIASYTLTDGLGARASSSPHTYAVWLFLLDALMMLAVLLATRGYAGLAALKPYWRSGISGGVMSLGAYWIVIWAMTVEPIAMVAAIRESSVLFAAAISVVVLKERFSGWRAVAALLIVAGIIVTRNG